MIIDVRVDDEMRKTYLARRLLTDTEIRKNIGLDVSDEVNVFYSVAASDESKNYLLLFAIDNQ